MAIHRVGSNVVRAYSVSCYSATTRVASVLSGLQRVSVKQETPCNSQTFPLKFRSHSVSHIAGERTLATRPASRPKAHTGRTTTSPRVRKPKVTTIAAAKTKEDSTAQTTKPKRQRTTGKTKVQATPKSKSKAKTKIAKPKPKVRVKKPLTEEGIAAQAAQEKRKHIKELKILALSPPKKLAATPYQIITVELAKEKHGIAGKEAAEKFKNLVPEELEHYNRIAHQNEAANRNAYEAWTRSLNPEDIRKANIARNALTRLGIKGYYRHLKDDRKVKRPVSASFYFLKDRYSSGEMHGMNVGDAARLIMREWKELGESDKLKYYELQSQSRARYAQEVKDTYHRDIDLSAATAAHPATASVA